MAITLEQIGKYLNNADLKYKHDEAKEIIFLISLLLII